MANKQTIRKAVNKLVRKGKSRIPALSIQEKKELKERIQLAIKQTQSGNA